MSLPSKIFLIAVTLLMGSGASKPQDQLFQITQFLDPRGDAAVVVINAGKTAGIIDGAVFESYRVQQPVQVMADAPSPAVTVSTGQLKAFAVYDSYTLARVTTDSTPMARAMFPKFPGVMAGDMVREKQIAINAKQTITPELDVAFHKIFVDPNPMPSSFEISTEGKQALKAAAGNFAGSHIGNLVIIGHTDRHGPSDANQIESYQRAVTVRQFLINELGFDGERVVALGLGEAQPKRTSYAPGYRSENRRIEMKVVVDPY